MKNCVRLKKKKKNPGFKGSSGKVRWTNCTAFEEMSERVVEEMSASPEKRKPPHMPLWNPPILACPDGTL